MRCEIQLSEYLMEDSLVAIQPPWLLAMHMDIHSTRSFFGGENRLGAQIAKERADRSIIRRSVPTRRGEGEKGTRARCAMKNAFGLDDATTATSASIFTPSVLPSPPLDIRRTLFDDPALTKSNLHTHLTSLSTL